MTPVHLPPGTYDVTVINPDGTVYKAHNALTLTGRPLDADGDGVVDDVDNCPADVNPGQSDRDGDGLGDVCDFCPRDPDNDVDGDGVCGEVDNCIAVANSDQLDTNGDGIGNACDCDFNNDDFCGGIDFTLFIGCFNQATGGNTICEAADMNGDGFVGGPDFTLFIGGFNAPPGPSGLVP